VSGLYYVCANNGDDSNTNRVGDKFKHQWRSEMFQTGEEFQEGAGSLPSRTCLR
jgi:hypothetical protein